ncbi:MAG TPA: RDD family protein [Opitutus sp.]|nr:RDD family protein [Opitutus sp.]
MFTIIGGDGREYGPATADQIRAWITAGRANLDTKAKAIGSDEWRRLGDYLEFAPAESTPPPLAPVAPVASAAPGVTDAPAGAELASRGMRFLAAFIDGVLEWLCWMPATIATMRVVAEQIQAGHQPSWMSMMQVAQASFARALPWLAALAIIQCALIGTRGQSIGKLLCRLRIVRHRDGAPAGFLHGVLLRSVLPTALDQVPLLGKLFWIVDSCFIFGEEKRCVHDYIGDTKVVKA